MSFASSTSTSFSCRQCRQVYPCVPAKHPFSDRYWVPDTCTPCHDKAIQAQKSKEQQASQNALQASWERLCPLGYRETDKTRLNQSLLQSVLSWKFCSMGLFIHGITGTGKTRAMWLLLQREHFAGRKIVAMSSGSFGRESSESAFEGTAKGFIHRLSRVSLLFIDELGKNKMTERNDADLFDIVESRSANKLPTMFTTNLSILDAKANLDPALVRRIKEFSTSIHAKT